MDVNRILGFSTVFFKYAEYDFKTKMHINEVVLRDLAREANVDENTAAIGILDSPIHQKIEDLAEAVHEEANKFSPLKASANLKCAQIPNVRIQPGRIELNTALEILQLFAKDTGKQNYFTDPNDPSKPLDIIVGPSANYGHVETEVFEDPEMDEQPRTVYINADRIVSESGGQQSGKAAALASAKVIAHEIGHLQSYQRGTGFQGGETPAEAQEMDFDNWLNSGMHKVENLPSYQALPG